MNMKKGKCKYSFKDLDTGKTHTVIANHPDNAIQNLNKKLGKKVNYSFKKKKQLN